MDSLFTAQAGMILLQIIIVDIVLSGDNAIVIAMAAERVPKELQKWAIIFGTGGAIVLRFLMALVLVWLLQVPYLRIVGALLLMWIGFNLLRQKDDDGAGKKTNSQEGLMQAVVTIMMANATMSLDNIMGIVGVAQGNIWLVAIGMCISVPILMCGSALFIKVIEKFPIILYLGGAILGTTAGEMLLNDPSLAAYKDMEWTFKIGAALIILGSAIVWNYVSKRMACRTRVKLSH